MTIRAKNKHITTLSWSSPLVLPDDDGLDQALLALNLRPKMLVRVWGCLLQEKKVGRVRVRS